MFVGFRDSSLILYEVYYTSFQDISLVNLFNNSKGTYLYVWPQKNSSWVQKYAPWKKTWLLILEVVCVISVNWTKFCITNTYEVTLLKDCANAKIWLHTWNFINTNWIYSNKI